MSEAIPMSALRLVPPDQAGPAALGILVPPGARTVLIVRPRTLSIDLLLVQGIAGSSFRELERGEAQAVARELFQALEVWSRGGTGLVEAVAASDGKGYLIWVDIGEFCLVACARLPGQPYQPYHFSRLDEARQAVASITISLHPPEGSIQEVYFNARHFAP
jgi:hypothetical protein